METVKKYVTTPLGALSANVGRASPYNLMGSRAEVRRMRDLDIILFASAL